MKRIQLIVFIVVLVVPASSQAFEIGFHFSGTVGSRFSPAFGHDISQGTPVNGGFVYETSADYTHANPGCACQRGYEQRHINGFWAEFGDVRIQADSYLIQIGNNVPQGSRPPVDTFTVLFASDLSPPLEDPILVNDTPYSSGYLSLTLVADAGLYLDSSLPDHLEPEEFTPSAFNSLMDTSPGFADIFYSVQSLQMRTLLGSDHDLDGDVDGRDFLIWQRYFGVMGQNGDANSDDHVNEIDLQDWQSHYGASVNILPVGRMVPEPVWLTYIGTIFVQAVLLRRVGRLPNGRHHITVC